jgi:hypothetical protein
MGFYPFQNIKCKNHEKCLFEHFFKFLNYIKTQNKKFRPVNCKYENFKNYKICLNFSNGENPVKILEKISF